MNALDPHALTLATARGRRLCKLRHADGRVLDYDRARTLDLATAQAPDLAVLLALLRDLAGRNDTCALRGAIADPARVHGVRRLLHADPKTGDVPTLIEVPRAWLALDLDSLPLPPGIDPRDLSACGEVARAALPPAFHAAACIVAATAGHGFKPGARLRLWCLLSRPLTGAECKRWLRAAPVDLSVFGGAQPIYSAAPLFVGMADPLPSRLVVLPGQERVAPPDLAPILAPRVAHVGPPPPPSTAAQASDARRGGSNLCPPSRPSAGAPSGRNRLRTLARAARAVMQAGPGHRHPEAVSRALHLARLSALGIVTPDQVRLLTERALEAAGKTRAEGAAIAEWALARAGGEA